MAHMKRIAAPKTWPVARKKTKWIAKPMPGAQKLFFSMSLQTYLTDLLKLASNRREVSKILNRSLVLVNGQARKDPNFAVGLFDVLKISEYNKTYRVLLSKTGKLQLVEIPATEANFVVTRVVGKTTIRGGKTQINLSNGWIFIAEKDTYKVGDTILFDVVAKKPAKHIKLEKAATILIIRGKHAGSVGKIDAFIEEGILRKKKFALISIDSEQIKIPVMEIFAIGEDKSEITLP